ncbi:MAG: A/G-specific adenine glycosylase [Planctomycetota bacterium]|nr:A/G-specific adenine glycosylase [Planctomycetota bacterium]
MKPPLAEPDAHERVPVALVRWFEQSRRPFPWRKVNPRTGRRDPYRALVSEFMLQQTQASRVEPAFRAFVRRFPSVRALARAHPDEVRRAWSGLGYYRRASMLHAAACEIVSRFGGVVPRDAAALRTLPGVGAYTAGAIASIVYNEREPIVDGNVLRVLLRLHGRDGAADDPASVSWAWAQARHLAADPRVQPGEVNEGIMEFGALVCTPAAPRCDACPLARQCVARRTGRVHEIPRPKRPPPRAEVHLHVLVVTDLAGRVLLEQLPADGLWARLWAPPTIAGADADLARDAARRGLSLLPAGELARTLTHRRVRLRLWRAHVPTRPRPSRTRRWVLPDALVDQGVPSAHVAAVRAALAAARP